MRSLGARHRPGRDRGKKRTRLPLPQSLPADTPMRRLIWRLHRLPRWAGTAGAVMFLSATAIYGLVLGGQIGAVTSQVTAASGFAIKKVRISGQSETREREILDALAIDTGSSLLTFNADAARERIARIPWIELVSVRALLPNTLQVTLKERQPLALWQRGALISVIDRDGRVITDTVDTRFAGLMQVVGHGAQYRAADLIDMLEHYPTVRARLRAAVLVADRRWNLVLENGIEVKLAESDPEAGMAQIARLDREHGLLQRDIAIVDLRHEDRLVIRLTEEAAMRRRAATTGGKKKKSGADT